MTTPNEVARSVGGNDDQERSTSAIRAEIEKTRERLGETVEALGAQLNPSHLKQRVKDSVREATIGKVQDMANNTRERISETGRGLAQTIRENPLPAAMAAAGLGWLLLSSRDQRTTSRLTTGEPDEFAIPDESYHATGIRAGARNVADNVTETAHDLRETASDLTGRAQEATQRVVQRAKATGDRVADRADEAMHRAQERARVTARRVENQFEENPMGLGAVALALGLAIGLSVPSTRREAELVGDARDRLVDKTRERVAETKDRVERVVERALPEVQNVVREVARDVRDAARDEGLSG
jgi:ElaB/YqjD/DUF883 family membrane-anchored ribosome-binding protein